jgi:hypothetical protein
MSTSIKELHIGDRVIMTNGEQGHITNFLMEKSEISVLIRMIFTCDKEIRKFPLNSVKRLD